MKPIIEHLPLSDDSSFVTRRHRTPNFEVSWHQHEEIELIMITEGEGLSFIGNYVGSFKTGDIFLLGPNLPHTFRKSGNIITSAIVIHFKEDFWGQDFLQLPECQGIKHLITQALQGLKIMGTTREKLQDLLEQLTHENGFKKLITLCSCLEHIERSHDFTLLSTQEIKHTNNKNRERIDRVFQYTMDNFKEPIQLSTIAALADMSVPAFCNYFKKSTRKKYVDFLNEVRIGYACKIMTNNTQTTIEQVCYESGFNTIANFNKQFFKVKAMTPGKYRKMYLERLL